MTAHAPDVIFLEPVLTDSFCLLCVSNHGESGAPFGLHVRVFQCARKRKMAFKSGLVPQRPHGHTLHTQQTTSELHTCFVEPYWLAYPPQQWPSACMHAVAATTATPTR